MTYRDKFILRMALSYLIANLDAAVEAYADDWAKGIGCNWISVQGDLGDPPTEDELAQLMKELQ